MFEVLTDSEPLFDSFNYCSFYQGKWKSSIDESGVCILFADGKIRNDQILKIIRKTIDAGCRKFHIIGERAPYWKNLIDVAIVEDLLPDEPCAMTMAYPDEKSSVEEVISIYGDYANPRHINFIYDDQACGTCYNWVQNFLESYINQHPE